MIKLLIATLAGAATAALLTRSRSNRATLNALYWQAHYNQIDQVGALRDIADAASDHLAVTEALGEDLRAVLNHIQKWNAPA